MQPQRESKVQPQHARQPPFYAATQGTQVLGKEGKRYVKRCVKLITHQEPIEGIQVWILPGYPSNILGYEGEYLVITIPRGN